MIFKITVSINGNELFSSLCKNDNLEKTCTVILRGLLESDVFSALDELLNSGFYSNPSFIIEIKRI